VSLELQDILEEIPYTVPWWNNLIDSFLHWPLRLWRRANTIIDMFQWQCQGKFLFYVRTALPALGQLVLGLLWFDWDDVVRGAIRPFGPFGRRSLVAGARKPKWKIEIPELGEEIGKRLPGVRLVKANRLWRRTRAFWFVDGLIQRVLYYYLIVDLVSEFMYNWSVGILRAPEECGAALVVRGGKYGCSGAPGIGGLVTGGPFSEVIAEPGPDPGFVVQGNRIYVERPVAILSSHKLKTVFPLLCKLKWRAAIQEESSGDLWDPSPWGYSGPGGADSVMTVFVPPRPGWWRLVAEIDWSTCYTAIQELEIFAVKGVTWNLW
jgi:hypothetical protein